MCRKGCIICILNLRDYAHGRQVDTDSVIAEPFLDQVNSKTTSDDFEQLQQQATMPNSAISSEEEMASGHGEGREPAAACGGSAPAPPAPPLPLASAPRRLRSVSSDCGEPAGPVRLYAFVANIDASLCGRQSTALASEMQRRWRARGFVAHGGARGSSRSFRRFQTER
ncbi:unnamed protein product [Lampetra planeri]